MEQGLSPAFKAAMQVVFVAVSILLDRLNLNSSNSSIPPSSDPNREKKNRTQGLKRGGQPGHVGTTLKQFDEVDEVTELHVDLSTLPAGRKYTHAGWEKRQVVDIEFQPVQFLGTTSNPAYQTKEKITVQAIDLKNKPGFSIKPQKPPPDLISGYDDHDGWIFKNPLIIYETVRNLSFLGNDLNRINMILLHILHFIYLYWATTYFCKTYAYGHRKRIKHYRHYHQPKPKWVKQKIIKLKALMPQAGCRTIAHTFNRLHQHKGMTVSKSYVNTVIRNHQYEVQVLKRKLKHKRPKAVPHNLIWGMDLTGKSDNSGKLYNLLAIIEHQSRSCLTLKPLVDKTSITLLECIIFAIKKYGKPKMIRTDNEAIFTSKVFRFGLWILGIKHQRTEVACPWQNGKMERFFGTLKQKLNQWEVASFEELNHSLHLFRFWYNFVRPHDYLDGATPTEVWRNKKGSSSRAQYFEAWDGLLNGYLLPP